MTIGDLIREYREKEHISIREFARRANISHTYICQLENNKTGAGEKPNLTVEMIRQLAEMLGADPEEIQRLVADEQEKGKRTIEARPKTDSITDEQVEEEIQRLKESEYVKLAKKEEQIRYRRRQYLYQLRVYERKGKDLAAAGITMEMLQKIGEEP